MVTPETFELENLIEAISNLRIKDNSNEMAEVNYNLFRVELESIPTFSGEISGINLFINACDRICTKYRTNNDLKDLIFQTILCKLRDRAKVLIGSRNELNTWESVKNAIISYFADKRDFGQLAQEFSNTKMLPREDPLAFGYRLQDLLSQLMTKLTQSDQTDKPVRATIYAQTALEVYLLNLPEDIQVHVKPLKPDALENAIGYVQDAMNFKARSNALKGAKTSNPPQTNTKPYQPNRYVSPGYQQNYFPNYGYPIQNPPRSFPNYPKPPQNTFPTGPIRNFPQPIQNPPMKTFTNRPAFGSRRNVWAPGQNKNEMPKPTPMSGVSTAVAKPLHSQDQSFPRSPGYLYNNEVEENTNAEPIFNEQDGLWYVPITTPYIPETHQEDDQEITTAEDEENFTIPASQTNLTD